MLKPEDIDAVKSAVNMPQLAQAYGFRVSRNGCILCPFHKDKHPSMKVYDGYLNHDGYRCYSCGKHGDIIHFVKDYEGLEFEPAVRRIAEMFGIPISGGELSSRDRQRMAERREELEREKKRRKDEQDALMRTAEEIHWCDWLLARVIPFGGMFCCLANKRPKLAGEWERGYERLARK